MMTVASLNRVARLLDSNTDTKVAALDAFLLKTFPTALLNSSMIGLSTSSVRWHDGILFGIQPTLVITAHGYAQLRGKF